MKKELIIFIPGADYVKSRVKWIEGGIRYVYGIFDVKSPTIKYYSAIWIKNLKKRNRTVFQLHWNGKPTPSAISLASSQLKELVHHYRKTHRISLIGLSLGGEVILEALQDMDGKIDSAVLLCSVSERANIPFETRVYNLYSPVDWFEKFWTLAFAPIHGGVVLSGENVINISLENLKHNDFCVDETIRLGKYKGLKISDLVNELIG